MSQLLDLCLVSVISNYFRLVHNLLQIDCAVRFNLLFQLEVFLL